MLSQLLYAALISALIVALAVWRGSLAPSGAIGAMLVGTLILGLGGWPWAILLGLFFVTSSLLSHFREGRKASLATQFAKGGRRDLGQTLANGGLGALLTILSALAPSPAWYVLFTGAMATVTADTWATELGTLSRRQPRLITSGRRVEAGTSGAVSPLGTSISLIGGLLIGLAAGLLTPDLSLPLATVIGSIAGLSGSLFDSLLGATIQRIHYCDICSKETERRLHHCGHPTRPLRGWAWMDNDAVNFLSSVVGAALAGAIWAVLR